MLFTNMIIRKLYSNSLHTYVQSIQIHYCEILSNNFQFLKYFFSIDTQSVDLE